MAEISRVSPSSAGPRDAGLLYAPLSSAEETSGKGIQLADTE